MARRNTRTVTEVTDEAQATEAELDMTEALEELDTDEVTEDEPETSDSISAKELASRLGIDPKSFRRWLRRHTDNRAGKGGRWTFSDEEANALVTAYNTKPAPETSEDEVEAADA